MTITPLNLGAAGNDGNGQSLRSGGQVINANFAELDLRTAAAQEKADAAIPSSQKGVASGVATLGADGKLPVSQLPPLAVNEVFTVASQAAMLALTAERGDGAIRTDQNGQWYVLTTDVPTVLANWRPITLNLGVALTALGALTPAADTIAYFSGPATAATTAFTAKARALLARTDTAGMQAELALVPVASNIDTTAGRLLTPGWMGLGLNHVTPMANIDIAIPGSEQFFSTPQTSGTKPFDYGFVKTFAQTNNNFYQIAYEIVSTTGRTASRVYTGGVWQAWVPLLKVGDYGYAANDGADLPGGSWNGILRSGKYRFSPGNTNGPGSGVNYGTVTRNAYQISTGTWTELTQSSQEPRAWLRSCINNTASQHYEIFSAYNVLLDPSSGGLMYQSVVNGWLVQKYANGMLVMTGSPGNSSSVGVNAVLGGAFTIPSGFIGLNCFVTAQPAGNNDTFGIVFAYPGSNTVINYGVRNGAIGAQTFLLRALIIGQWK